MPDLDIVGGAAVDVVPVIPQFHAKLKALVLPIADKVGEEAGKRMGEAISKNIVIAIPQAINQGGKAGVRAAGKQGDDAGGAFARSIRRKLEAAFKAMPKLDIKLGDTGVDADLARIRAKLEQLSGKRIGIDVTAEAAEAEITRLEARLRELGAQHPNVAVRADTATARAALAAIRAEIAAVGGRKTIALEVDGAFGAKLRSVVAEAQASIPDINIDADTSPARAEIQGLRARLAALSDVRVGIDIDAGEALAEVEAVQARLAVLSVQRHDIDVRVDAAAAAAQLAALRAMADDTKIFHIRALADTSGASSALLGLTIQAAALVAIPLGPVLAAGLGAVAAMATAAAAGVGSLALVAIPAIKGVGEALKAKTAAEDDAARATSSGARANVQAAQRALQLAGAQASLTSAHRNAARSIASANRQVEDAERALAQAGVRAMDQRRQAAESVERAERSLADAQAEARRAEQDLTQARRDAAQQLADLNDRLLDGALDQREATLRVEQAQQDLNAVLMDPRATDLQIRQAQLSYDRAKQNAQEQAKDYATLQKSAAAQKKAGVEGSDAVKAATERLSRAQRDVADNAKGLADAQREAARAQTEAAQTVADAQRRLADAVQNAADTQVSASESIASAERGLQSARLSGIDTTTKAITKQDEYRKALAKLTPAQRELFDSIAGPRGLKNAFDAWQKSLQPEVLPLFTRGVDGAKNSLPGLTPMVLAAARGIDSLMDSASAEMKTPFWQSFKADLTDSIEPAIKGLGKTIGLVLKGAAGVVDAFLPHMDGIADRAGKIAERFAKWGTNLKGSPDFERFLQYVKDTSPGLAEFLGDILRAALDVSKALAPLSTALFDALGPVFDAISWTAKNAPEFIQLLWGIYFVTKAIRIGMAAFAVAMFLYESVMILATIATSGWAAALTATGIVPIIQAIVLVVALLAAGVVYAYKNWDWFRAAVDGAWAGIKAASEFVWYNVLKPIFDALWFVIKGVGDVAVWLWKNAIVPAFNGIMAIAKPVAEALLTILLIPAYLAFKLLGAVVKWLWKEVVSPVFSWIGDKVKALYEKYIKPHIGSAKKEFENFGQGVKYAWDLVIKPALNALGDKVKWLYDKAIKPAFKRIDDALSLMSLGFKNAKDDIKREWDQLSSIAKKPVKFIIEHVYNGGIVPLWNAVADITGGGKLKKMDIKGFHTGGIMSGYSPGRDDRVIAVGGGEAVMRPEWTRAVGADRINSWNAAARSGGISGVQRAISSGMPAFADGGIVGWFKDRGNDVGRFVNGAKNAAGDALGNLDPSKLFDKATGYIKGQLDGIADNKWAKSVSRIPLKMLSALKDKAMGIFGGGGDGSGNVSSALSWARTQAGKPYQWGGNGDPSWDCSGLMSAIESVIRGEKPHRRWATGSFNGAAAPSGWVRGLRAPFMIGVTNAGVGHTAGTLAGVNVESRGGDGVVVGPRARSYHDPMFRDVYGFRPSIGGGGGGGSVGAAQTAARQMLGEFGWGDSQWSPLKKLWQGESGWRWNASNPSSGAYGIPQSLPGSKMASAGADWRTNPSTQIKWGLGYIKNRPDYGSPAAAYSKWLSRSPHWYDNGGYLPEGLSLVANGTGKPEPVFTSSQWDTLRANAGRGGGATTVHADVKVYVGDREITDIVRTEVVAREEQTAAAITTGRWV
ncbi:hypothetical protein [Streptomyces sp. NPDC057748]|uniref:aggregation-promoting factor C-terminal-like domain-containing protein n=1 Tax=unclassified Streptomyces TaxID=2593676 RepID=UPI0036BEFD54